MKNKPKIVCAACWKGGFIVTGPRHFDNIMRNEINNRMDTFVGWHDAKQGFIDQFGGFYDREEAMIIVKASGQPFNIERNGGSNKVLYSEGLY